MENLIDYTILVLSVLLVVLILVQSKGAGLGAGFGGDSGIHQTRRGAEKGLYIITIVIAIAFVGLIIASLFI